MMNSIHKVNIRQCYLCILLALLLLVLSPSAFSAKVINIGVVMDGPIEHISWAPELFKNELIALARDDFDIRFPADKQLDGGWSAKRITEAHKRLQADPKVDIVLALGYVSSAVAVFTRPLNKPTFAPFVMDATLQGLPKKNNVSGIKYLNYLSGGADFVRDLRVFNSVADCKKIAVFVDEAHYVTQPGLVRRAREVVTAAGVELVFIQQHKRNEDLAARLTPDIDCTVVTDLARLNSKAMEQLIGALIEKKIPSYSLLDSRLVEQGLLMAEAPASDWRRLARRNALNIHSVLHGELAGNQPVSFKSKRRLVINMETSRLIGISPRFDILNDALLLNEEVKPQGRVLTLATAAVEAVEANLDLRASALGLEVGLTEIDQARARLLPQLNASLEYTQLNDDSTGVLAGASAEQSNTAAITLSQLIYSDSIRTNVEIQRYLQSNREALKRQLELDIIQEAATTYLSLLKAQTLINIRREDMGLSRANLELARDRQQIGVATPAEVYRWESQLATSRQELLDAQATFQQSRDAMNRLLHRPLKELFIAKPITLEDPRLIVSHKELFEYVSNDRTFELMGDFLVKEGMLAAPEMEALNALIDATKSEIKSRRRAYWSPTVTLQGQVTHVLDEQRLAGLSAQDDTDWSVSLNVSLPLFEGGARRARLTGSQLELSQLHTRNDATRERIEQRIRSALHRIGASYPSIQLSEVAAAASKKNLDLVTDAYSRGAVSILDLLDAQNAALVAKQAATNAVFDFLIDLMNLQRSAGQFDFFLDTEGMDEWLKRLQQFVVNAER